MTSNRAFPTPSRVLCDFVLGLLLFAAIVGFSCGTDVAGLSAHAGELTWPPEFTSFDVAPPRELRAPNAADHLPLLIILGVAFASTFALNLWFFRHVSRVYAPAKRGGQKS